MSHFLVVGTGRCGTTWATEALSACGLRVAHQAIRHEHVAGAPFDWDDLDGVASYEAVPILADLDADRVVLLVRDPMAVVSSYLALGVFDGDMAGYEALVATLSVHAPQVLAHSDPLARAVEFWLAWNALALPYATAVRWPRRLPVSCLAADCGHPGLDGEPGEAVGREVNHRDGKPSVLLGDLEAGQRRRVGEMVAALS